MLEQILSGMVEKARGNPGKNIVHTLKNGLEIKVKFIPQTNAFRLGIYRIGSEPSMKEWETVLRYWPWNVNVKATRPVPYSIERIRGLWGFVPVVVQEAML